MRRLRIALGWCAIVLVLWPKAATAEEELKVWWARTPPPVEEISGGKLKAGERITKDTVELVKDYMPYTYYLDALDGAEWEITAYTPGEQLIPHAMLKATKENLGKAVISPSGTVTMADGSPWIGGFPVPQAKTGLEVMVNRQFRATDGDVSLGKSHWVSSSGEIYKNVVSGLRNMTMTGRVNMDPRPAYEDYDDQLTRSVLYFEEPYELKGTQLLTVLYVDQDKYPDAWLYSPVQRRLIRLSLGQRYDSVDGSLVLTGDFDTFSDPLGLWNFELVERRFLFSTIVGPTQAGGFQPLDDAPDFIEGDTCKYPRGGRLELRDTFVIEATPKIDYIYSKKRLYADAATYLTSLGEFYNQEGKLYKQRSFWFQRDENEYGPFPALVWIQTKDYQSNQATLVYMSSFVRNPPKSVLNVRMLTLKYLTTQSR